MREAGKRSERIKIFRLEKIRDEGGGTDTIPVLYWSTWAEIEQVKGSRVAETFQDRLKQVYSIVVRFRNNKNIESNMLVEFRGKTTAIHTIDNERFKDKFIELIVSVG